MTRRIITLASVLLVIGMTAGGASAADIELNADCRLFEAINAANSDSQVAGCPAGDDADTIHLSGDIALDEALPTVISEVAIAGGGHAIDGGGARVFRVGAGGELALESMTLQNGGADEEAGACVQAADEPETDAVDENEESEDSEETAPEWLGGAICVDRGSLYINDSALLDNAALDHGGAIAIYGGTARVANSEISGNRADGHGGAIYSEGGALELVDVVFSDNRAAEYGGAIDSILGSEVGISGGEFAGNQATTGGAIGNWQSGVSIRGGMFHLNAATNGGAIQSEDGRLEICESEFRGNAADEIGAGIYVVRGRLTAADNLLNENTAGDGGVMHIVEPENAELSLRDNIFADNDGERCVGCPDDDESAGCNAADADA